MFDHFCMFVKMVTWIKKIVQNNDLSICIDHYYQRGICHNKNIFFCGATVHLGLKPTHYWGFWITHNFIYIYIYTHTHTRPVGLLWTSVRLVAETATYTTTQQTSIHVLSRIRTRNPSNRAAAPSTARPPIWENKHCKILPNEEKDPLRHSYYGN